MMVKSGVDFFFEIHRAPNHVLEKVRAFHLLNRVSPLFFITISFHSFVQQKQSIFLPFN